MKFYCEECEEIYDEKDLNERYYLNLGEDCYECPGCENRQLTIISENTELAISWDEEIKSITLIEYNTTNCEIIKVNRVSLKNIAKVIQHYMNYFELESAEVGGLSIQKMVDKN